MKLLVVLSSFLAFAISEPPVRHGSQYFGPPPPISSPVPSVKYGVPTQRYVTGPSPTPDTAILGKTSFIVPKNTIESLKDNNEPITLSDLIGSNRGSQPTPVYGVSFNTGLTTQSYVVPSQISFGVPSQTYGPPSPTLRNNGGKSNRGPSPAPNSFNKGKRPHIQNGVSYASAAPSTISRPNKEEYGPQSFPPINAPIIDTNAYLPFTPQAPQVINIPQSAPTIINSDEFSSHFPSIESSNSGTSGHGGKSIAYDDSNSLPANYEFEYSINDPHSGNDFGHREARQEHSTRGRYYVQLPDGRRQIVDYEADHKGYRTKVTYEGEANFNTNTGYSKSNTESSQMAKPMNEKMPDNINSGYRY